MNVAKLVESYAIIYSAYNETLNIVMSEPLDMAARDDLDRVRDALQNAVKELRADGLDINLGYLKTI